MFDDFTKYRVLKPFFRKPTKKFQLREISRETEVSLPSVKRYVEELEKEEFLERVEEGIYPGYKTNSNERTRVYKKLETIRMLHESGLVDRIDERTHPNAVVLFGSATRGEDTEKSDLDLLVVAGEKEIELEEYEKEFNRQINIQFVTEEELMENDDFANSVANGITLKGFLKVR